MATLIQNTFEVGAPPERAFELLSNLANEPTWNPTCKLAEKITDGPVGVGTKYRAQWKGGPVVEVEISTFDAPHSWSGGNKGSLEVTSSGRITPEGTGSRVEWDFEAIPHGFMKLMAPMILAGIRKQMVQNIEQIKTILAE